jgi:tetratricopeptide (TPR) repeat protein
MIPAHLRKMEKIKFWCLLMMTFLFISLGTISCGNRENVQDKVSQEGPDSTKFQEMKEVEKLIRAGEFSKAKNHLLRHYDEIKKSNDTTTYRFLCENLGLVYYQSQLVDSAIGYWQEAEKLNLTRGQTKDRAANLSNLGSAYMFKGYYQTAISHFLEARSIFEEIGEKSENYWISHLNIGVSNMELRNYKMAEQYFLDVPDSISPSLKAIKQINLAKLFALQKQSLKFKFWIESAEKSVENAPYYLPIFKEVLMEFGLDFGWKEVLQAHYPSFLTLKGQASVYYDIMLCETASFLGMPEPIERLDDLKSEISAEDFITLSAFHQLKAHLFEKKGEFKSSLQEVHESDKYNELLENQKSRQDLLDFTLLSERKDMEAALHKQIEQNELQEQTLRAQVYFILALVFLIVLIIGGAGFLIYKQKNKSNLDEAKLKHQEEQLKWVEKQQMDLQQEVKFKNEKLQSVLGTVTKLAILKKQIDGFFKALDEMDASDSTFRTLLKRLRLDFNSFFNNYQDLAIIANLDGEDTKKVETVKLRFPILNDNEQRVVLFITQKYTSKEMSTLLSCTEKNIEYYRTQIRRKLEIPKDQNLADFLDSELNVVSR